jgi:hypothetical protein
MKFINYLLSILILTSILPDLSGQIRENKHHFLMYVTAPTVTNIEDVKSNELDIGEQAWTFEMGVETKLFGLIGISGGLGYGSIKDHNSFSQNTTWGVLESSFSILTYDFKAGMWTPELDLLKKRSLKVSAGLSMGYEGFSGRREIVNCEDCQVEKYKFKGGFFVEPEISFFFYHDLIGLGTSYRYYFGNIDLMNSWTILKIMVRMDLINN